MLEFLVALLVGTTVIALALYVLCFVTLGALALGLDRFYFSWVTEVLSK